MKDNWFEDKMNERFEDFDSELDLHSAWADLEERRNPKKQKKRSGIFWWFGAGIAVVLLGFTLILNSNNRSKSHESNSTTLLEKNTRKLDAKNYQQSSDNQKDTNNISPFNENITETIILDNSLEQKTLEKLNYYTKKSLKESNLAQQPPVLNSSLDSPFLLIDNNETETKKSIIKPPTEQLHSPIALIIPLEKDIPNLSTEIIHHNIECDFEGNFTNSQAFGLAFNYGKAFRSSPIGRGLNSAYWLRRDLAETPLDAWSAQLFYQLKNKKYWFAQVNLGYSQTTNLFEDTYTTSNLVIMDNQVLQINMYPDGLMEEIKGTALVNEEEKNTSKFYQRYSQAFIGLEFGKEKYLRNDFKLRASVGADFTIYQNNSGKIYSRDADSFGDYQELSSISSTKGGVFAGKLKLEIGKIFGFTNEISIGLIGKTNLKIIENDLGRRQYLLSELSYRKNF